MAPSMGREPPQDDPFSYVMTSYGIQSQSHIKL